MLPGEEGGCCSLTSLCTDSQTGKVVHQRCDAASRSPERCFQVHAAQSGTRRHRVPVTAQRTDRPTDSNHPNHKCEGTSAAAAEEKPKTPLIRDKITSDHLNLRQEGADGFISAAYKKKSGDPVGGWRFGGIITVVDLMIRALKQGFGQQQQPRLQ